ncbi:MAG: hypothetical protein ACI97B_002423 [Verrucomicrobiales bacterium]
MPIPALVRKGTASRLNGMKDLLLPLGIIAAYLVLQIWVLPRFGVKT